jgi:hypothetical protein
VLSQPKKKLQKEEWPETSQTTTRPTPKTIMGAIPDAICVDEEFRLAGISVAVAGLRIKYISILMSILPAPYIRCESVSDLQSHHHLWVQPSGGVNVAAARKRPKSSQTF